MRDCGSVVSMGLVVVLWILMTAVWAQYQVTSANEPDIPTKEGATVASEILPEVAHVRVR